MRRLRLIALVSLLSLAIIATSGIAFAQGPVNGVGDAQADVGAAMTCSVLDEALSPVTSCRVSDPWGGEVVGYWAYFGGECWSKATVLFVLAYSDLPEKAIVNTYAQADPYCGNTISPFGITDWNPTPSYGYGIEIVATDVGTAYSVVTILPY